MRCIQTEQHLTTFALMLKLYQTDYVSVDTVGKLFVQRHSHKWKILDSHSIFSCNFIRQWKWMWLYSGGQKFETIIFVGYVLIYISAKYTGHEQI